MEPERGYRLGLTGFPLGHSLSPRLHNAALRALGLPGEYGLFPVPPHHPPELMALLDRLRLPIGDPQRLDGLNVTIPHKQAVFECMEELTPAAKAIGAVNSVFQDNGRLTGENTDADGFMNDLRLSLQAAGKIAAGLEGQALVLGAGGAARAVVYALQQDGWQVTLAARRFEQARFILADAISTTQVPDLVRGKKAIKLIVNATPAGMAPGIGETPWQAGWPFPGGALVYDLVYNPPLTRLMSQARAAGLEAVNGLGMLIEQAALALALWTGRSADLPLIRTAMQSAVELQP